MRRIVDRLTFEHVIIAAAIMVGLTAGVHVISDNSTLMHLATGIHILDTRHVPQVDIYSFTAHGHQWIVQSWLPEVAYALMWKWMGGHGLQLLNIVLYGLLATIMALLARTGDWRRTLLVLAIGLGLGYSQWSPRPLVFGLLCLAFVVAVLHRRMSGYWLFPVGLLWVNTHGTWPLGLGLIGAMAIGEVFDRHSYRPYVKYMVTLAAGVLVGGLASPAGWRILTFPLTPFQDDKASVFSQIVEWQSPNFRSDYIGDGLVVLVCFIAMAAVLMRNRQPWRNLLPILLFTAAALLGARNLPSLGIVAVPVLAAALRTGEERQPTYAGVVGATTLFVIVVTGLVLIASIFMVKPFNYSYYPTDAVKFMKANDMIGPGRKVLAPDFVGDYLAYVYGTNANVFIDDRYDMYPTQVEKDNIAITALNKTDVRPVFNKYDFDAVLYRRDSRVAQYLTVNPKWKEIWSDDDWQVFVPVNPT